MKELKLFKEKSLSLFYNNKAVSSIIHNLVQHNRTNHIEIDPHFIKKKVVDGYLCLYHVSSNEQVADVFTKKLYNKSFHNLICKLGMGDVFAPTWEDVLIRIFHCLISEDTFSFIMM